MQIVLYENLISVAQKNKCEFEITKGSEIANIPKTSISQIFGSKFIFACQGGGSFPSTKFDVLIIIV